jgi:polar amino acid transport system substrate-binding protein
MKTLILAAALALTASAAAADALKIGMAPEPYPPFAEMDASGKWVGWEIELLDAVMKNQGVEYTIVPTAWDGIIPALTAGQIDVIWNSMSITEERLKTIDFSDKYYNTPTVVIATKGAVAAPTAEALAGKIIGVQVSTVHQAYVEKYFAATAAEVKTYQTQDEANQDLAAGRIDAIQADSITLDVFLASDAGKACCELVGTVADDPVILGLGVGAGVRKGEAETLAKINAGIAAVRADGTYDKITAGYFASSIYGD